MDLNALAERLGVVAALEHGDEPALGVLGGEGLELLRVVLVVAVAHPRLVRRVERVRVEARREHHQVRGKRLQPRHHRVELGAEVLALGALLKRQMDNVRAELGAGGEDEGRE